ncbi:hypothetical protein M758_5G137600 [Ceratodon purpureus]|uniref:Thioredoxin-like protein 4A n=1 Tax=Ceratodon purpureus TaxID=3225 RepID=A0A8T0I2U7_CERPU|nr:hypothetical protein KC19_5G144100 [Ceratodon purpureus]KAG0616728.1 hypothetical protein M758_5G137600 [Ceratodon purpureus]
MSYLLRHLHNAFHVDHAIQNEEERVTIIRFGCDSDTSCMEMIEFLMKVPEKITKFAVIYLVDIKEVPDFNVMYELYYPCTVMFFFRNKHIMVDLGISNNNKINWAVKTNEEFIAIIETVYKGAKNRWGLVVSPKDYSTKFIY